MPGAYLCDEPNHQRSKEQQQQTQYNDGSRQSLPKFTLPADPVCIQALLNTIRRSKAVTHAEDQVKSYHKMLPPNGRYLKGASWNCIESWHYLFVTAIQLLKVDVVQCRGSKANNTARYLTCRVFMDNATLKMTSIKEAQWILSLLQKNSGGLADATQRKKIQGPKYHEKESDLKHLQGHRS